MTVDKSFTKKDLCEIISLYEMDIEDYLDLNKATIQNEIISYLKYNDISFIKEFPDIHSSEDLKKYLSKEKPNNELNYKQRQEIIQISKKLIQYCRGGYSIALSKYESLDEIYSEATNVSNYCDIPTCRRAITEINLDPKIRNKIPMNMSLKIKQQLTNKAKNKQEPMPALIIKRGKFDVVFG